MTNEQVLFLKSLTQPISEDLTGYDIKSVLNLASRQNILPLCYENLSKSNSFETESFLNVQTKVLSTVFSQTKRTANFKRIYKTIVENGIEPLVLKGIVCRNLYGESEDHRPSGDEDILVKKSEYFKLSKILTEQGFTPEENVTEKTLDNIQEITFKSPNGLNIEVHLNIIGTENKTRKKMNSFFSGAFDTSIVIDIKGQNYRTLGYTEHYIYLFYHMFKHFSTAGVGIRQILDMLKFGYAYRESIDFETVYNAVKSINAEKLYGDIIEIGNRYLGFNNENIFGVSFPDRLCEDMFSAGAYGNISDEQRGSKVKVLAALDAGGKPSKMKMLFPSLNSMREHYTILHNHPYLLPVMWVVRAIRYVFRTKTGRTYNVSKSEHIADKKIQLLRDYEIIP